MLATIISQLTKSLWESIIIIVGMGKSDSIIWSKTLLKPYTNMSRTYPVPDVLKEK